MSLRKSRTLTPALLASNRRNAKKSTGPRTAQGKAWSRLNRLRNEWRCVPVYILLKKRELYASAVLLLYMKNKEKSAR
jgi:hypothetical protein